ncbi:MAG TPA: Zn-ribbon domain-containing OB-fold protein [bacterium]|nr:Zn-ribbon domain-containing OB-fold protein [bacterium]
MKGKPAARRPPARRRASTGIRRIDAPPRLPMRGHGLSDVEFQQTVPTVWWEPKLEYGWDAGEAIGRFLAGLKAGKIYGVRCRTCGRTVTPPRAFCELDFKPMDEWVELPDTGTVNTFSVCYITWDMKPLRRPQIPAVIEIDGTTPRVGFLHLLGGVSGSTVEAVRKQVQVGTPVRAVWRPLREREGAITDILYFAPLKAKGRRA